MKIITINLPEKYLTAIQTLNDLGIYDNRSSAIRIALRDFLKTELQTSKDYDNGIFDETIKRSVKRN